MSYFDSLFKIDNKSNYSITGLNKELNSIYIYDYFTKYKINILVFCNSLYEANDIYNRISSYTDRVLFFPMDDFIASEATSISPEFMTQRLGTLNKLCSNDEYIVVTNMTGILRYLPNKELYESKFIKIAKNDEINRDKFINDLYELGYESVPLVSKSGEMAIRGYVIDIFPIEEDNPIRIEFWGDDIDSIKYFDLDSQLSNKEINNIDIYPFTEFLIDKELNDDIIRKQKYLLNYSSKVSGIWDYLDDFVMFYYDYNQIITSYGLLRETILNYDEEVKDSIKTKYMYDIDDIGIKDAIYMMDIDN